MKTFTLSQLRKAFELMTNRICKDCRKADCDTCFIDTIYSDFIIALKEVLDKEGK